MVADCVDGFPACDGVGADHGVDGGQVAAGVFGGTAWGGVEFEVVGFGGGVEFGLGVGGG